MISLVMFFFSHLAMVKPRGGWPCHIPCHDFNVQVMGQKTFTPM